MAFYQYKAADRRTYPTLDLTVSFNDVVDWTSLNGGTPPDLQNWQANAGPATVSPTNAVTYQAPGSALSIFVPPAGAAGAVLRKNTPTDYDYSWQDLSGTYAPLTSAATRAAAYRPWNASVVAGTSNTYILGHSVINGSSASTPSKNVPQLIKSGILGADPSAGVAISGNPSYTTTQLLALVTPFTQNASYTGLTIFMGLLNDYSNGIVPSVSQSNIAGIVAKMKAIQPNGTSTPGFLILVEWVRGDVASPAYPWSQYVAAAQAVAAADPTVRVLDLGARLGSAATATNLDGLWNADQVHPTDKACALIAKFTLEEILSGFQTQGFAAHYSIPAGVLPPLANTRWSSRASVAGGTAFGNWVIESDGAISADITFGWIGQAGTYAINLASRIGSNRGQYSVYIDGVAQAGGAQLFDGYAASPSDTIISLGTTFTVAGNGSHTIRLLMSGKNASSTAYVGSISGILITRTGP